MKTPSIRNILVPIDFSKMSIQAIETAKRLAQRFGATVHLVHVHGFDYPAGFTAPMPPLMPFSLATYEQEAEKRLARQLNALATKHGSSPATCHLLSGAPAFDEICRIAKEIPADLIVMPTHGRTGLKRVFLGSTAERIVQHSPSPVFVTRQTGRRPQDGRTLTINTILVPVDFSGCSLEGLNNAIQWAEKFAAKIFVLNVVDLGISFTGNEYGPYDLSKYREMARQEAERHMQEFVRMAKFGDVKFETAVLAGPSVDGICAFAQRHDVDLVITSTHGLTGFKHVLIGSTAEHVVRHAPCPVLVVPSHPKIRAAILTQRAEGGYKPQRQLVRNGARKEKSMETERFTRKFGKVTAHAFPERRKTNKFREYHSAR